MQWQMNEHHSGRTNSSSRLGQKQATASMKGGGHKSVHMKGTPFNTAYPPDASPSSAITVTDDFTVNVGCHVGAPSTTGVCEPTWVPSNTYKRPMPRRSQEGSSIV